MAKPHPEPFPQRSPQRGAKKNFVHTLQEGIAQNAFLCGGEEEEEARRGKVGKIRREGGEDQKGRCGRLRGKEWKIKKEGGQDKREGGKIRGKEGGEDKRRQEE